MKIIIFDSSTIINLAMNGLLDVLRELKKNFDGKFIVTYQVKYEIVDRPIQIAKFELGALKIKKLIDDKILEMPESIKISREDIQEKTREILRGANHLFLTGNEFMHIIDDGEASCLALSIMASNEGIKNIIAIDERTTRIIVEKPENLHKLLEQKFNTKIKFISENLPLLTKIKIIRSSELMYVAWKKGLIDIKDSKLLEALLYATKYNGASISREEIEEIKRCNYYC